MWKIQTPLVDLLPGFELREDERRLYLFFGEREVASFDESSIKPEEITRAAQDHLVKTAEAYDRNPRWLD